MPVIYCQNCGAKNSFADKKPTSCSKCKKDLDLIIPASTIPQTASKVSKAPTPSFKDPKLERKRALLLKRRGRVIDGDDDDDDEEGFGDDEEDFGDDEEDFDSIEDIPRPSKLAASIEVERPKSISSIGGFLKSVNPEWGNE